MALVGGWPAQGLGALLLWRLPPRCQRRSAATPAPPSAAQVRAIPLDRLLLESDSPDGVLQLPPPWLEALPSLAHVPAALSGAGLDQLNRPCVLRWTLQLVAAARGETEEAVAEATRQNAARVFCWRDDGAAGAAP